MEKLDEIETVWLQKVGAKALRKLWAYSNEKETPQADRVKIWQFMAEMAFGKAGVMEPPKGKASGCGLVILPAVPGYDDGAG